MESDPQTISVAVQYTDNKMELITTETISCRQMLSTQTEYPTYGLSIGIHSLFHYYAENYYVQSPCSFLDRQYVRQCHECLLRTENLGVHLFCCCPRTNYEHLWTSLINCMGYRQYGKWMHKSQSDQCQGAGFQQLWCCFR